VEIVHLPLYKMAVKKYQDRHYQCFCEYRSPGQTDSVESNEDNADCEINCRKGSGFHDFFDG
jgi:hypothetical protein